MTEQAPSPAKPPRPQPSALLRLARFLRPHRWLLAGAIVSLALTVAITLSIPFAVRNLVNAMDAPRSTVPQDQFTNLIFIAIIAAIGFSIRFYLIKILGELTIADLRRALFAHMVEMSPAFFEKVMTGEVISRITSDTTVLLNAVGWSLSALLRNCLVLVGGLIMLAVISIKLTLLVICVVPVFAVPLVILSRRLRDQSRLSQELVASSTGAASEALSSVQAIQAFTNERLRIDAYNDVSQNAFYAARRVVRAHVTMTGTVIFVTLASVIGVVWIGANDVQTGAMTSGDLALFIIFAVIVAEAANGLTNGWGEVQRAAGAAGRVVDLLEAKDSVRDPDVPQTLPSPVKGEIVFEDVGFCYPSSPSTAALTSVNLRINPGETVALVGPSGAGKSTILQLLLRFYDPTQGRILFDGIDLRDMTRSDFRKHISFVPQDPAIFAQTAAENIQMGRGHLRATDLEKAAKIASAHTFLSALPNGYDSFLGERGAVLSGGQKQRLAIARAVARDTPILLLDEATSALDVESETAIQQSMAEMSSERTTIIVAHRLSTVKQADRIVVFEQGRIAAQGTHDQLVAQNGTYARLSKLQFLS